MCGGSCYLVYPIVLVAVVSAGMCGCGNRSDLELGRVTGIVTLDGAPLPNATVLFTPAEGGRPSSAVTDQNGHYELMFSPGSDGALPGAHVVSITTASTTTDDEGNDVEVPEKIPVQYNANTELRAEVNSGSNTINFDLSSEGEVYREE